MSWPRASGVSSQSHSRWIEHGWIQLTQVVRGGKKQQNYIYIHVCACVHEEARRSVLVYLSIYLSICLLGARTRTHLFSELPLLLGLSASQSITLWVGWDVYGDVYGTMLLRREEGLSWVKTEIRLTVSACRYSLRMNPSIQSPMHHAESLSSGDEGPSLRFRTFWLKRADRGGGEYSKPIYSRAS